jgi:hypothetical protein
MYNQEPAKTGVFLTQMGPEKIKKKDQIFDEQSCGFNNQRLWGSYWQQRALNLNKQWAYNGQSRFAGGCDG